MTVTGPGGIGKTRLAMELLDGTSAGFPGGSEFVELAGVRDPGLVLQRIAASLGIPETLATGDVTGLACAVAGRPVLVVLDNLEHLLPAAALSVAELVGYCPDLVVVVTSRAALHVRAEREFVLQPLAVPDDGSREGVLSSPAAQLFLDRAAATGAEVELDERNVAAVAEICRRLDGVPLAVELVAAGSRLLTPVALLERMDAQTPSATLLDLEDRQRSMSAAVDWSLDLLDGDSRALFRRLGVFTAGFTLPAAAAVGEGDDVLTPLASLVDQSLVSRMSTPDGRPRYRLLEPIRQYAASLLADSADAPVVADRHASWFRDSVMAAGIELRSSRLRVALDSLEADHANLRTAYSRLEAQGRLADATEMVGPMWLYLALRGHAREALGWLGTTSPSHTGMPDEAYCRALSGRLGLMFATGDVAGMRGLTETGMAAARRQSDPVLAAETSTLLGHAAVFAGDLDGARECLDVAWSWANQVGGNGVAGESNARWIRIHTLVAQGQLALAAGALDQADAVLTKAVDLARELGNEFSLSTALTRRATVATLRGDDVTAAQLLGESIELSAAARMSWTLSYALPALAGVAVRLGQAETAARLFGASASLSAAHAVDPRFPVSRQIADRDLQAARDALGDHLFGRAWDAGRTASQADVAEAAREVTVLARS